jgi:ABC-type oligopeptide transport system substrate-binding subunit/tetratricopeptide (TPR) repeat protein
MYVSILDGREDRSMSTSSTQQRRVYATFRLLFALILGLLLFGFAVAGTDPTGRSGAVRQKKDDKADRKRTEEEDDDVKPKKRTEEEDDDPKAKPKKRAEDEDDSGKRKTVRVDEEEKESSSHRGAEVVDLARAAREAKHPAVKELFEKLAAPYDEVTQAKTTVTVDGLPASGGKWHVAPLPDYITDLKSYKNRLTLHIIDSEGKELSTQTVTPRSLVEIRYHEQIALEEVKKFLKATEWLSRLPTDNLRHLSHFDQLVAADQALSAVFRFHRSAREREVRKGDAWNPVERELRRELLNVQLEQLKELTRFRAWDQAFTLTRRLADTYTDPEDHKLIAKPLAELVKEAIQDTTYTQDKMKEARERLHKIEERFPGSTKAVSAGLREQAKNMFQRAMELRKEKRQAEALELLKKAEDLCPDLPNLRAYRIEMDDAFPILRVSMRELPRYLSPARAFTDSERRCVDLLFESLVNLLPDERGAMYYEPSLAVGRVRLTPLGRQFVLPHKASWSDGRQLNVGDLRFTLDLLKKGEGNGRCAAWGDLLDVFKAGSDPCRVKVSLRQGFLDPLSVMSFKLLPARPRPHPTSEAFAERPISSGPFLFGGHESENNRTFVSFPANPYYGVRIDKSGLPRLKQIRVFASPDPVKAAADGAVNFDLLLDLTAEQAAALRGNYEVPMPSETVPNRRIYFLAVNHRNPMLAKADMRLALARAIPREVLLDEHFRKGLGRKVHKAISGPYPARSWACNPALVNREDKTSQDCYDKPAAQAKWSAVWRTLGVKEARLKLKYPAGDRLLAAAMTDLCERVNKELQGIHLTPEECAPHALRADVEETHSYELAYYWYDFPDESLWLKPLLGPNGPGGSENYLGYSGKLVSVIETATGMRYFKEVRDFAHAIHRQVLDSEMPIIPLWQLDPLYAYRKGRLKLPPLDPLRVFAQSELWRVNAAGGN